MNHGRCWRIDDSNLCSVLRGIPGEWVKWLTGAIHGLSPEVQSPVDECTCVAIYIGVLDNHSPCPDAGLAPNIISYLWQTWSKERKDTSAQQT